MTTITLREQLLEGLPVAERRLTIAGADTAVLEGGDGPPLVLLHGPGGNGAHWGRAIGALTGTHRVIAPDLPGQGASEPLDAERVLEWLGELIERTCAGAAGAGRQRARRRDRRALRRPSRRPARPPRARRHARPAGVRPGAGVRRRAACLHGRPERAHARRPVAPLRARPRPPARGHGRPVARVRRLQPRPRAHPERAGRARGRDGALRPARDPGGRARADRRPDRAHLGPAGHGHATRGRGGGERSPRLAAARDRGLRRRPAGRASRGVRRGAPQSPGGAARPRSTPATRRRRGSGTG